MLSASQRIPWKGKLASQARAAEADADAAEASVEARRVAVVTELRRWYLELAYLGAEEDVVREELSLLAHFEELSRARYEAGTGLQQAPIKIQAEITELQLRLLDLEARRASARAALSSLLDRPADRPVTVAPLPTRAVVPVLSTLRAAAFGGRPELAAADDAIAAADARVDRARRERFPDVTTGLSWTLVGRREDAPGRANPPPDDGQDVLALTASANLPVWRGRLRALVEEAALRRQAVGWRKRALLAAIDREITDTLSRLAASAEQLDLYRAVLVPQAEQSLESVLAAYAAGAVGALDLLDAERVAFRVRVGTERARADHAIAVARLEGAIAAPLASLPGASGPAPAPAQEDRP
jgi:outer membrane protein TolC